MLPLAGLKLDRPQGMLVGQELTGAVTRAQLPISSGTAAGVGRGLVRRGSLSCEKRGACSRDCGADDGGWWRRRRRGSLKLEVSQDQNGQGVCNYECGATATAINRLVGDKVGWPRRGVNG
jgi:hypothetical protein